MTYGATLAKHLQSFQLPVETVAWVELARDRLHWRQSIQPGRFRDKAEEKEKERGEKRKKEKEWDDYNEVKSQGAGLILDPFTGSP